MAKSPSLTEEVKNESKCSPFTVLITIKLIAAMLNCYYLDDEKKTLISNHWQNLNDTLEYANTNVINSQINQVPILNSIIFFPIRNRDRHLAHVTNYVTYYVHQCDKLINLLEIIAVDQLPSDMQPFKNHLRLDP